MDNTEYSLLDSQGKTIAMGTQNQMFAYIKHHVPDGRYRIVGQNCGCTACERTAS